MKHHLMKEEDTERFCPYCSRSLRNVKFTSAFFGEKHYKHVNCGCGRHLSIKIKDFVGSGHDDWDKRRIQKITIEDKIRAAEAKE